MTKQKQRDILSTQTSTEKANKDNYNLVNEAIEGTPFRMYGDREQGFSLILGNNVITKPEATQMEALNQLEKQQWNIIANTIIIIMEKHLEFQKNSII